MTLETSNLLTWLAFILAVGGFALIVMLWAYVGSGSRRVIFANPINVPEPRPTSEGWKAFDESCVAFRQGKFRAAIAPLTTAIQSDPTRPEFFHNLGMIQANLRQDNEAVRSLVRAGELYLEGENSAGYERIKADLELFKQSREGL
ncbi:MULTISPECIES: hypothetical protein [unclassified Leptolyngbya]|uniref:tetratricopeptide repeat protein n=1 Tax=unclassified Leptolyngbya TaxID=2650499 RepID=UPI001682EF7A|nr:MULTISPECIES: hypothetical protein [unclassified Leptolyngbya]MBD1911481.1 hypothetical protein [Leptolyngbya sp. FACHB-8]MBD2155280.1 hypothetical protein [Leptolyngbya sp. FACHB-16]